MLLILHMLNSLCYMQLHVLLLYVNRGLLYVRGLFLLFDRVLLLSVVVLDTSLPLLFEVSLELRIGSNSNKVYMYFTS